MRETTQERISWNGLQIPNRLRCIRDKSQAATSSPECVCLPVADIASLRQHHERSEKASFKIALLAVMCIGSQITTKLIVRHKTKGMDSRQNIDFQPRFRFGKPAMGLNTMPNQHEEDRTQPCSTCQSNPCHSSSPSSQIGFAGKSLAACMPLVDTASPLTRVQQPHTPSNCAYSTRPQSTQHDLQFRHSSVANSMLS